MGFSIGNLSDLIKCTLYLLIGPVGFGVICPSDNIIMMIFFLVDVPCPCSDPFQSLQLHHKVNIN